MNHLFDPILLRTSVDPSVATLYATAMLVTSVTLGVGCAAPQPSAEAPTAGETSAQESSSAEAAPKAAETDPKQSGAGEPVAGGGDESPQPAPKAAKALAHFVPQGWKVADRAEADLDEDGDSDVVALLEYGRSGESVDSYKMPTHRFVIVVLQDEPLPRLAAINAKILLADDDTSGRSLQSYSVEAREGEFSIVQNGLQWSSTLRFDYTPKASTWYLEGCTEKTSVRKPNQAEGETKTEEESYPYTAKNDLRHYDRDQFADTGCPFL